MNLVSIAAATIVALTLSGCANLVPGVVDHNKPTKTEPALELNRTTAVDLCQSEAERADGATSTYDLDIRKIQHTKSGGYVVQTELGEDDAFNTIYWTCGVTKYDDGFAVLWGESIGDEDGVESQSEYDSHGKYIGELEEEL